MIPPRDESEARAKASSNARDLVDKLEEQSVELHADGRFAEGAALAEAAKAAAVEVLRLLSDHPDATH